MPVGQFDWGGSLLNCNEGVQRFPQDGRQSSVECKGVGLHSGAPVRMRILPAAAGSGIVFRRTDLDDYEIEAVSRNVAKVMVGEPMIVPRAKTVITRLARTNLVIPSSARNGGTMQGLRCRRLS